ncbi:putative protein N-methyltransferase FAM86B1 [Epargyreus clarus]|uniref:putative protein N-methyltransferase FAM86B1 n=1 Tax=Epargyreus clarus TaxID=520877 RepID=UPI003C2E72C6
MSNNDAQILGVIRKLTQHFLRGSLQFTISANEVDILTPNVQEEFLQSTIHLDRLKKYPLNNDFCQKFFKKLISLLEPEQEIHDEIYSFLCSAMEKASINNEFCYHHYVIDNNIDSLITIKETKNMVVNGTTGMKTWEAAFMLSDWALCHQSIIADKKILELGSGVGFTGVTIAKHCDIQSIILSDCHQEVLSTIRDNIRINFPEYKEEETSSITVFSGKQKSLGVTILDWNCVEELSDEIIPDILIGADIVYDPTIIPALCNVINTFFKKNNNLEVYIASVVRNEETFTKFLEALDKLELQYFEIIILKPVYVEWDCNIQRRLLKNTNKNT